MRLVPLLILQLPPQSLYLFIVRRYQHLVILNLIQKQRFGRISTSLEATLLGSDNLSFHLSQSLFNREVKGGGLIRWIRRG